MIQSHSKIPWDRIRLLVLDLDGTLYQQLLVRLLMSVELTFSCVLHMRIRHIRVLREYRRYRENLHENFMINDYMSQILWLSKKYDQSQENIRNTIDEWIQRRPLKYLHMAKFPTVDRFISQMQIFGAYITVLSDLPIGEKLRALDIKYDYSTSTQEFSEFKPNCKALFTMIQRFDVTPDSTLVVGDRPERDGIMASSAGCHFALVKNDKSFRMFLSEIEQFKHPTSGA